LHIVFMDEVFKALADASRRELLDRLRADNGQTLGELCARLAMTRQAVSKHLAILEDANLVAVVWRGPREAALPQSGADPRHRGSLDREIRTLTPSGAERT
jgi:DNA-binding transcriptional ArsR family regulator